MRHATCLQQTILFLSLFTFAKLKAQEKNVYSTLNNKAFHDLRADVTQINEQIRYATSLPDNNSDSLIALCEEALTKSINIGYSYGAMSALGELGNIYSYKGSHKKSFEYYKKALKYIQGYANDSTALEIYTGMSVGYRYLGKYDSAAYYSYKALDGLEHNKGLSYRTIIDVYNSASVFWSWAGEPQKASYYLKKSENIIIKNKDTSDLARLMFDKGNIYEDEKQWDSAMYYCQKAVALCKKINKPQILYEATLTVGTIYILKPYQEPQKAIPWIKEAIKEAKYSHNQGTVIVSYYYLGMAYYFLHDYKNAESLMLKVCSQSKVIGDNDAFAGAHSYLARIYKQDGNYIKAFSELEIFKRITDSIHSEAKAQAIHKLDIKYHVAEKDKALAEKQLQLLKQQINLKEKNFWIEGTSIGLVLLTMSFVFLYRSNKHKQSVEKEKMNILQQKQAILEQEKEIGQLKAMMQGEEEERKRIARELHDGIGGMLAAVKMNLTTLKINKEETAENNIDAIINIVQDTATEVRRTAHNLMPDVLTKHNLEHALLIYLDNINIASQLQVDLQFHGSLETLSKSVELIIYRIIQELIQNIIKHAKATKAEIQITQFENNVSITVEDNGIGFDINEKNNGMGLQSLQFRVKGLQGDIFIQSAKDMSTTVFIEFDLQKLQNA